MSASEGVVTVPGCPNLRDLGGTCRADGAALRPRQLFRSDTLTHLDDDQRRWLRDEIGLRTVVDLRDPAARARLGTVDWGDAGRRPTHHALPLFQEVTVDFGAEPWDDPAFVASQYRRWFDEGREVFAEAVRVLGADGALPGLVHCTSGRDRTSVVVAVLLAMLGVDHPTVGADHARSGPAMEILFEWQRVHDPVGFVNVRDDRAAYVFADARAVEWLLDGLVRDHGSWGALASELGLSEVIDWMGQELFEESS